jgi:outer membrane lipoprotein-sorting protein
MLMVKEDMWAYIPNLGRATRVALSQRLTGEAAIGDIARMRWSGDYQAKVERETTSELTLDLQAKRKGLTYERIKLTVTKPDFRPISAVYLSLSGEPLKTAAFSHYQMMEGAMRPKMLKIRDAKQQTKWSEIVIKNIKKAEFADALFNKDNLGS